MSLGLFTLFTTLYKTAAVLPTLNEVQADVTYITCQVVLWRLLESSVTIIAGSIPTWGWLLRTSSFQAFVTWLTVHSSRINGYTARAISQGTEGIEMHRGANKKDGANQPPDDQDHRAPIGSIGEPGRSAAR